MIITFCGHSEISESGIENKILDIIKSVSHNKISFYLGGYGDFDNIALNVCSCYRLKGGNCSLYFITPYLNDRYLKNRKMLFKVYDDIIFPELEKVPPKFAILRRNQWMIQQADLIIAYVKYSWGGAYQALEYAKKLKKPIINIAEYEKEH